MTATEAICTAIVGGFTVLGAAVRWSAHVFKGVAGRVVKAIDDSTAAWKETSKAVSKLAGDVAALKQNHDIKRAITDAVEEVVDEVSGVHEAAAVERKTPPGGYDVSRLKRPRAI